MRAPALLTILVLPVLAAATPAFAQPEGPGIIRPNQAPAAANAPPPALPGLAARPAPAPIAPEAGAALGPNASLFDAINRGDIAAARDAVGRGADLGSRNLLGLTPIDAAVDQGRTEIAFYLLAARGTAQPSRAPATASIARPPGRGAPLATPPAARGPATPAAVMQPKLWADDGGTPRPEAGFLGFDAGRPAGAQPPPAAARRTRG